MKSEENLASAESSGPATYWWASGGQLISAIRGQLAEYGLTAPQGPLHIGKLIAQIEDPTSGLPQAARTCLAVLVDAFRDLQAQAAALDAEIAARAKADDVTKRLMTAREAAR